MKRAWPLLVAMAVLSSGQQSPETKKLQKSRARALDAAAMTPFMTKRGADSVKRVMQGAESRKSEEDNALAPAQQPAPQEKPVEINSAAQGAQNPQGQVSPGTPQQQPPAPEPTLNPTWRLIGISYGSHKGAALFDMNGQPKTLKAGEELAPDIKVVAVTKNSVTLSLGRTTVELNPW